jgi:SPP1 gp7 family putative phage head morphogenesis protein
LSAESEENWPSSKWGHPDDISADNSEQMFKASDAWADAFVEATRNANSAREINSALVSTAAQLSVAAYADEIAKVLIHSSALGILDSATETDDLPDNYKLEAEKEKPFSQMPFAKAMKKFSARLPVPKSTWNAMSTAAKARSFTIAGLQKSATLSFLQGVLADEIRAGNDSRFFAKAARARMEEAGLASAKKAGVLSAAHIENVYRTNGQTAYNAGRSAHQTTPQMLAKRPVWEIRGIRDPRTRETHIRAHGVCLWAHDPWWQTGYPPFGFQCRCRVAALPASESGRVVAGSTLRALPDPGFVTGIGFMFG